MPLLFATLLIIAVHEGSGCASLPKGVPLVDLTKIKGPWYETLTSIDPISLDHACRVDEDLKVNPTGFKAIMTLYFFDAPKISFPVHDVRTKDGYFKQKTVARNNVIGNEETENGNINSHAVSEYRTLEWEKFTLLGDPDHYIAYIVCVPTGLAVWVFTKEKSITPQDLVNVHNDLVKHGVSVPLRLSHCQDVVDK